MKKILLLFSILFVLWGKPAQANGSNTRCGNLDVFAELLVWHASQQASSAWASELSIPEADTLVYYAPCTSFDWDLGFRGGIGYQGECSLWDTQLYWTWFRTKSNEDIPLGLSPILPEFFGGFISDDVDFSGAVQWRLLLNTVDWELARTIWIDRSFSLRPFIGLKGACINQTIHSQWDAFFLYIASEDLQNNFWGIGPSGGVSCKWHLDKRETTFFNLFGGFSTAMMWGTWMCSDKYRNPTPKAISVNMRKSELGALMFRGFIGLEWGTLFNCGRSRFTFQLGYEMQYWLNQLRIPTFQQLLLHGDLTLQGGTCNCRIDF